MARGCLTRRTIHVVESEAAPWPWLDAISIEVVSPTVCGLRSCDERDGALAIDSTSAEARNAARPTPSGRAHPHNAQAIPLTQRRFRISSMAREPPSRGPLLFQGVSRSGKET